MEGIPVRVEDHGRTVKVYIMDVTKQPQSYGNRGITTGMLLLQTI